MNAEQLIGRWSIVSWQQRYDDGRITFPLGEALEGFIQYDAQGRMSCMMGRADRANFLTGGQWNANEAERAAAYSGFMAYSGRYSVDGDLIIHHVDISLFPNWKGGDQKRRVKLTEGPTPAEDTLDIVARLEEGTPEARSAVLAWKRG